MKKSQFIRVISLMLLLTMLLPAVPSLADTITSNGGFVDIYTEPDLATRKGTRVRIDHKDVTNEGGWYRVFVDGGYYWIPANSVTVTDATPTSVVTATPTYSLAPGATPTPTPAKIEGEKDPTFTGEVLSYTVPTGGLFLYNAIGGTKTTESVQAGVKLTLTEVLDSPGWYSLYHNGKTYYVPSSILYMADEDTNTTYYNTTTMRSIAIVDGGSNYYTELYTMNTKDGHKAGEVNTSSAVGGFIDGGQRINVRYATAAGLAYAYTAGGKTYYLPKSAAKAGESSSALVSDNDSATFVTQITISSDKLKLYKSQAAVDYITLPKGTVVYGVKDGDDFYKVTYDNQYYYIKIAEMSTDGTTRSLLVKAPVEMVHEGGASMGVTIPAGTTVTILDIRDDGWYQVEYNGNTGWIQETDLKGSLITVPAGTTLTLIENDALTSTTIMTASAKQYEAYKKSFDETQYFVITYEGKLYAVAEGAPSSGGGTPLNLASGFKLYKDKDDYPNRTANGSISTSGIYYATETENWDDIGAGIVYKITVESFGEWYALKSDIEGDAGSSILEEIGEGDLNIYENATFTSQIGYNDVMLPNSYWVTASKTMKVYTKPDTNFYAIYENGKKIEPYQKNLASGVPAINAGESFLASPYNTNWYAYVPDIPGAAPKVYYILKSELSGATASSSMSSLRATLNNAQLYISATSDAVPASVPALNGEYVVRPINNTWYSIVYNSLQYYVKASQVDTSSATPMPNMTDGKSYRVTIGPSGAVVYKDVALTDPAASTVGNLAAGMVVDAKRYSSSVYQVNLGGVNYYISVSAIGLILGGDDAAAANPGSTPEGIGGIIEGEKDAEFSNTVLSYTVKAGGLWLFYDMDFTRPALSLSSGTKLTLTAVSSADESKYTTWYGGEQYYVQIGTIYSRADELNTTTSYSVTLGETITLYGNYKHTTKSIRGADGKYTLVDVIEMLEPTTIERPSGMRINVKVASFSKATGAAKNTISVYSTQISGKTYYFPATNEATNQKTADQSTLSTALVASNVDTSLITKIVCIDDVVLYITNNETSEARKIKKPDGSNITLYGVSYDSQWYKVIYDGAAWYIKKSDPAINNDLTERLSITSGTSSTTFAVTIGAKGARVYSAPSTNAYKTATKEAGTENWYKEQVLAAGTVKQASWYSAGWYSFVQLDNGNPITLYFQNTTASNANNTGSISSIIIAPKADVTVTLYTTTSTNDYIATESNLKITLEQGRQYTVRRVNSSWYSIAYQGNTYYIKASNLGSDLIQSGTPVATTSVGNKYTIIVGSLNGGSVPFYKSSLLQNYVGDITGGTQMTGTKLYVEETKAYVFEVLYDGVNRYISADNVVGVKEGDEVTEAKYAEQESGGSYNPDIPVGESVYAKLNAGTGLYHETSTDNLFFNLTSTGTYHLTRVSATWYRVNNLGSVYYVLASEVFVGGSSGSSGTGTNTGEGAALEIGESTMQTLKHIVYYYSSPSDTAPMTGSFSVGQLVRFTKISDYWFEVPIQSNGTSVYVKIADVYSASSGTGTGSSQTTTDGTGIITSYIMITATSGTINMRKQATTGSTIMANIPINTQLKNNGYEVSSKGEVWYKVTYNGVNGYVIGTYVKAVGTVDTSGGTVSPTEDIGRTLYVDTTKVNIRSGAGTNHSIVGYLEKNYALVPTNYAYGNDGMLWYAFAYSGKTAYIRADYLRGGVSSTTELSGNVAIKSGGTNLRSGAGDSFGVIKQLERGVIVTIIGSGTDSSNTLWYRVSLDGVSGYLRKDTVRQLTTAEQNDLLASVAANYTELKYGSKGSEVLALQNQLIATGYLAAGSADGIYGTKTTNAVMAFQRAKGLSATGVATSATQASLFNTSATSTGSTVTLNWFTNGVTLLKTYNVFQVYDVNSGVTWTAKYVEGANHADVVPNTAADAQKLKANNITGSYVRRPVICTINGQKYAGSMYAVGHGTKNFVSFFSGVMCIHFTGSQTHGSGNVDADHQAAIQNALNYGNQGN